MCNFKNKKLFFSAYDDGNVLITITRNILNRKGEFLGVGGSNLKIKDFKKIYKMAYNKT